MVKIYYASMTGLTPSFLKKVDGVNAVKLKKGENVPTVKDECILMTYTHVGKPSSEAYEFAKINKDFILGIIGFGDRMWGKDRFCKGGKTISESFKIPYLRSIERTGTINDVQFLKELIDSL